MNEVVDLKLVRTEILSSGTGASNDLNQGAGLSPSAAWQQHPPGVALLVAGRSSDGTVVVWDVLRRQLLSAVHLPMCSISCIRPLGQRSGSRSGSGRRYGREIPASGYQGPLLSPSVPAVAMLAVMTEEGAPDAVGDPHWRRGTSTHGRGLECNERAGVGTGATGTATARIAVMTLQGGGRVDVGPGPDLSRLPATGIRQKDHRNLQATDRRQEQQSYPSAGVTCLDTSDDGSVAALGTDSGQIFLWDTLKGGLWGAFDVGSGSLSSSMDPPDVAMSPGGEGEGGYSTKSLSLDKAHDRGAVVYSAGLVSADGSDSVLVVGRVLCG